MMKFKKDIDSWPPPSMSRTVPRDEAKQTIVGMVEKTVRPVLVGVVAMKLGHYWNLARTEELFDELVYEGHIRKITKDEQEQHGLEEGYFPVKPGVKT